MSITHTHIHTQFKSIAAVTFQIIPSNYSLLLLLLSHFSHVRLCATPQMSAHQAPPSLGFSRQGHWSGLSFPSPMHKCESEVAQLCPTLSDPMDRNLPGSSVYGIFQARVLEWGAIAFSKVFFAYTVISRTWETLLFCSNTGLLKIKSVIYVKCLDLSVSSCI